MPPHGAQIDGPVLEVEHRLGVLSRRSLLAVAIVVGIGAGRQVLVRVVDSVLVEVHPWYGVAWLSLERHGGGMGTRGRPPL